jgi:hypothetical protein
MHKLNCWQFKNCGKEPGGQNVKKSGICPIALESSANGLNGGVNGGRICWVIADILKQCVVRCDKLHRKHECFACDFRYKVVIEEGFLNVCKETGNLLNDPLSH